MYKKFSLGLLVAALFLFARPAAAVTVAELQAQIQVLLAQITVLQQGGGASMPAPSGTFRLVTPNGGDQWQLNSQHAITWQPDPQNASTTAYLEKKTSSGFKTVGKIIPVGKGSIIWDGEIRASGTYPRPGNYYVRLENLVTGESDRSDKAFTLLKPGALVGARIEEINGEEPDEELHGGRAATVSASDENVSVTWKSKSGVERCSLTVYNAYDTSKVTYIDGLPASGTETITLPGGNEGEYYIQHVTCYRDDGSGTGYDNIGDDFVYLIIGDAGSPKPYIKVTSPNGGETWYVGSTRTIMWSSANLTEKEVHIRLMGECGGVTYVTTTPDDGSYTWIVPSNMANDKCGYKVRVATSEKSMAYASDESDNWFSIPSQMVPYYGSVLGADASYKEILNQMASILHGMQEVLGEME